MKKPPQSAEAFVVVAEFWVAEFWVAEFFAAEFC
jgi:hypothetical protein